MQSTPIRYYFAFASALASLALLSPTNASAFTLTPMSVSFDPSGAGATRAFQVDNPSEESVALEVYIIPRSMSLDGQEDFKKNAESGKNFLVYPPELLLKPREKRTIRVSYTGDAKLDRELAYRIVVEQLPVKTKKSPEKAHGAVINMLLRYVGAIYVTPAGAKADISLKEAKLATGTKPQLSLLFENKGNAHKVLNGLSLKVTSSTRGNHVDLPPEKIPEVAGQNILANSQRRFLIPWPTNLPKDAVKVEFELKDH